MKSFTKILISILALTLLLIGCSSKELSDNYSKEKLDTEVLNIIKDLEKNSFQEIIDKSSQELKSVLTVEQLETAWNSVSENAGEFQEISTNKYMEKDGFATVIAIAKHSKRKVQYTLSFNKDMELVGIYLK